MTRRKVAILGTAPTTLGEAPMEDDSWEIWCSGPPLADVVPRLDRWIEVHCPASLKERLPKHHHYLSGLGDKLWSMHHDPCWPDANKINKAAIEGVHDPYWLSSSIAWMMAMAMIEGVDVIGLYGVEMSLGSEYSHQRPGIKHLAYMAGESGIEVIIPRRSELSSVALSYPENYEAPHAQDLLLREEDNMIALSKIDQEAKENTAGFNQIWGQKNMHAHYKGAVPEAAWTSLDKALDEKLQEISDAGKHLKSERIRIEAQLSEVRSMMRRSNIRINHDE